MCFIINQIINNINTSKMKHKKSRRIHAPSEKYEDYTTLCGKTSRSALVGKHETKKDDFWIIDCPLCLELVNKNKKK